MIIDAERSDLLMCCGCALPPLIFGERAGQAEVVICARFNTKQQAEELLLQIDVIYNTATRQAQVYAA